ncbi:ATP-binding protein [Phenylobacterium sp.]|uniref:ATP-binding protein n=1 Tax=Phenylobacterium sp. TaxID=1871053 RepID=UPI00301BF137
MTEEVEQLREALASARQQLAAQEQRLREQDLALNGIAALQAHEEPETLIAKAFDLIAEALAFDRAMFLELRDDRFVCIASTEPATVGCGWRAGPFFRRVADGRAAVVPDEARVPEWAEALGARPLVEPLKGAIYAPISAGAGPGLLVLSSAGHGAYSPADLRLVSRLGIFVSQTLAAAQRRRLAEAARAAETERSQAVEASEAKSRFLANMSHEIRTPLNGVTTVAVLLAESGLQGRQREMAGLIVDSSRALEGLLNDILDLAKVESGRLSLEEAPFELPSALASTFELFAIRAEERDLAFDLRVAPEARGWFSGDAARVRQVAANLLSNAVKFTERGEIGVSLAIEDGFVTLEVRDTGVGFDAETAARLFRRFEQADGSVTRRFGGTGLGLALSRTLAGMMDGDIACRSAPGEGSTFTFRFPARPADAPVLGERPSALAARGDNDAPPLTVLVAEDNPNNRTIVGMVLEAVHARTVMVENGAEAVAAFAAAPFDIVLMDLQMPVMDGLSATRRIRELERRAGARPTPIIALSANAMTHHVDEALAAGSTAHVAKPIDPHRLIEVMLALTAAADAPAASASAS